MVDKTDFIAKMKAIVGSDHCWSQPEVRMVYERDANFLAGALPSVVVGPQSLTQLQAIVRLCRQANVPWTVRGAGTGQSGGAVATQDGVVMTLSHWRQLDLTALPQRFAWVEPGVINAALKQALRVTHQHFAPDPSSQAACTLGGNWAENAGGIHCVQDGVTADHTLALTLVSPLGETWTAGHPTVARSQGAGLGLLSLLIGSEGTLGVLTRGAVRVIPYPACVGVFLTAFSRVETAAQAVAKLLASGVEPSALELMDAVTVACVNQAFGVGFPDACGAVLLTELQAHHPQELAIMAHHIQQCLDALQPLSNDYSDQAERTDRMWQARRGAAASYGLVTPAFHVLDCVIPRSQLAIVLREIDVIAQRHQLRVANVFHAGDGNLHPHLFFDPKDRAQGQRVKEAASAISALCVGLGGTLSGEHGIGLEKRKEMALVFTEADLYWMHQVKRIFDPTGLCNPDKILPAKGFCGEGVGQRNIFPTHSASLSASGLWI